MRTIVLILLGLLNLTLGDPCTRPEEIVKFEEECFNEHSGLVDKIQHKATGFLASAKKRFGIETAEEESERKPQKCQYYHCVLKKMSLINEYNLPDYSLTVTAIEKYPNSKMNPHSCFQSLATSFGLNNEKKNGSSVFRTNINDESEEIIVSGDKLVIFAHEDSITVEPIDTQLACEIASALYQCVSEKTDDKCSIFRYP